MTAVAANAAINGTFIATNASTTKAGDVFGCLISIDTPFRILTSSIAVAIWVDRLFR